MHVHAHTYSHTAFNPKSNPPDKPGAERRGHLRSIDSAAGCSSRHGASMSTENEQDRNESVRRRSPRASRKVPGFALLGCHGDAKRSIAAMDCSPGPLRRVLFKSKGGEARLLLVALMVGQMVDRNFTSLQRVERSLEFRATQGSIEHT
ncbi:predicted protein [Chaetomium globosum CBS 148.51]|uniref:Uncharacterized protein n=1 Tax=Chaetomium globosum (strain ATCC 6205 / CBS 148.51 / DSM 1962 / NBRC 6347 / NRRL 1970) TaxID=306901 RepID=Q2H7R1_CHAGB|nr:uncharacterized protein CHGG_05304 [Chaetomium globosum CBS 148.51]EAQ88685.1 predicted protein [Chaetomium globosum CBS 148.51]